MLNVRPGFAAAERGGLLGSQGRYNEAIAEYTQAIAVDPGYLEAYVERGLTYKKIGQYRQAIADCDRAIALGAQLRAYGGRGEAYLELGEYRRAIADFNQFIKEVEFRSLDGWGGEALIGRGRAYAGLGDFRRGVADLTRAIQMVGGNFLVQRAYYYRGNIYTAQHKYREALADYDRALAIEPQFDDTDTQQQHEAAIKDLHSRRDEAYRLSTGQGTVTGAASSSRSPAQRASWLSRLFGGNARR